MFPALPPWSIWTLAIGTRLSQLDNARQPTRTWEETDFNQWVDFKSARRRDGMIGSEANLRDVPHHTGRAKGPLGPTCPAGEWDLPRPC